MENNGKLVNFINIINNQLSLLLHNNQNCVTPFHRGYKFYLLKDNTPYVLCVDTSNKDFIVKMRFSLGGVLINFVTDSIVNGFILRKSGNKEIIFKDNHFIEYKQDIKLRPIQKPSNKDLFISNPRLT
jgi:hypothetical protein